MADKVIFQSTPRSAGKNTFYNMFMDSKKWNNPAWVGIDWCAGNGNIRGEVIKQEGNVTHVRFNTLKPF